MLNNMENNKDKIVNAINEFQKTVGDTAISIHGKQYSLVATRLAVTRRELGSSLDLRTSIIHQDDKKVIVQVDAFVDGNHLSTGTSEELRSISRINQTSACLLYTSPSPRDRTRSRMPSSA